MLSHILERRREEGSINEHRSRSQYHQEPGRFAEITEILVIVGRSQNEHQQEEPCKHSVAVEGRPCHFALLRKQQTLLGREDPAARLFAQPEGEMAGAEFAAVITELDSIVPAREMSDIRHVDFVIFQVRAL